jgi:hypothetical protein
MQLDRPLTDCAESHIRIRLNVITSLRTVLIVTAVGASYLAANIVTSLEAQRDWFRQRQGRWIDPRLGRGTLFKNEEYLF